jgi:multidrug transporter EmrE-like cation transporter
MAWFLLLLGGFCEVGFTTCLHKSENLTHWNKNWILDIGYRVLDFLYSCFLVCGFLMKHQNVYLWELVMPFGQE